MKILVTAGNTQSLVDRVRCITNIFTGKTGARIAATAFDRGHALTFLTSHPEVLEVIPSIRPRQGPGWNVKTYRTYDDLAALMSTAIPGGAFDAVVHTAAVNDYEVAGIFAADRTDVSAGKIKGSHPELWLKLVPTPKLVDRIRTDWGFRGTLVKFKLEVGVSDEELLKIAEASRIHSGADLMVANTLDGYEWAFVGSKDYVRVSREALPAELVKLLESIR
jgi:phosphopantothenate-cysteine ligase/phosphopantothenoylcysteine decarboxylase/phosphopantothenate--cysteine ligase